MQPKIPLVSLPLDTDMQATLASVVALRKALSGSDHFPDDMSKYTALVFPSHGIGDRLLIDSGLTYRTKTDINIPTAVMRTHRLPKNAKAAIILLTPQDADMLEKDQRFAITHVQNMKDAIGQLITHRDAIREILDGPSEASMAVI